MAYLEIDRVTKRFRAQIVMDDISLKLREGEMLCLLGPSGCGKTTTLRIVAGFEAVDSGMVRIGGADVTGLPPEKRDIGLVFQSYALFPHLTVDENVAFGLRMRRKSAAEIAAAVKHALALVRLEGVGGRLPRQLSGGQQQRVALARAIAIRPRLLLLDEPLSNLDASLRDALREEIRQVQKSTGLTALFVTHDQQEALAISDRIAVMRQGRILQVDTPQRVYEQPANAFVASFIGQANLLHGRVTNRFGTAVRLDIGGGCVLRGDSPAGLFSGEAALAVVKADRIGLSQAAAPPDRNSLPVRIEAATFVGPSILYTCVCACASGDKRLTVVTSSAEPTRFAPGDNAIAAWLPADCLILADEAQASSAPGAR